MIDGNETAIDGSEGPSILGISVVFTEAEWRDVALIDRVRTLVRQALGRAGGDPSTMTEEIEIDDSDAPGAFVMFRAEYAK